MKVHLPMLGGPLTPIDDLAAYIAKQPDTDELTLQHLHIKGGMLEGASLRSISLKNVVLEGCRLLNCHLEKGDFTDVRFQACDFSGSNFTNASFGRCEWLNTKALGTIFCDNMIMHTTVQGCNLQYTNWDGARLDKVAILNSNLSDTQITGCNLKNIYLEETEFYKTNFFKTPLAGLNFTTCHLEGITVASGFEELQGAVVNAYQAADLAKLMGVIVR